MNVIEYQDITVSYGEKPVLQHFTWAAEKGAFVTIIGSSGCGKTTVLKMVNGLVEPQEGAVLVHGKDIQNENMIQLRRNIGYAIQGSILFPHMNVEQNISYVPRLLNKKDKERTARAVDQWMRIVGLEEGLRHRYPDELSGGQQQRVGIARSLAASPDILLMDEPFGAVDEITRSSLQDEMKRIHKETGITILFVTHDIKEALKLGTMVLVMDKGKLHQYAPPEEIMSRPKTEFVKRLIQNNNRSIG